MGKSTPTPHRRHPLIDDCRLIVVKIGSALLTRAGGLNASALHRLGAQLAGLWHDGRQVLVVSSGAVASGRRQLGLAAMPTSIVDKQAAAAIGQQVVMAAWSNAFAASGLSVAQVLLTADDLDHRQRYLNARHTLQRLLAGGVVPIINENDSVSFEEIKMGDNDHLSALVTTLVSAHLLILLTNTDGLRAGGPGGKPLREVPWNQSVERHIGRSKSATGIGGMRTKVQAARLVNAVGIPAIIASGRRQGVLIDALAGKAVGTLFEPAPGMLDPRRRWLATVTRPRGMLIVDAGAQQALMERKASLLPAGIIAVEGRFDAGAVVRIADERRRPFARGLASYSAEEIGKVKGHRSAELPAILGYRYLNEIVHRNDLVLDK